MLDMETLADLDAEAVCARVGERHEEVLRAECELFVLAAHWADLHPGDDLEERYTRSGRRVLPGMERGKQIGADGTPAVEEFAAAELGALQGMGPYAARNLIADALNVRHRHPRLWGEVLAGRVRVWQARKTAQLCEQLEVKQARQVDAATTPYLAALPWSRFLPLVEAKVTEADPVAAEARRKAAAMARFVRTGESDEYALKTLVARAAAGDVIFFVAMVDRIAQILAENGDTDRLEVRRSKAIGVLATPARALHMLQTAAAATDGHGDSGCDSGGGDDGVEDQEARNADDPAPQARPCPTCAGNGQGTGDPAAYIRPSVDPRKLLPSATLYIHMSQHLLGPDSAGVARFEGVGPITRQQVIDFLRHCNVRVVPVLDVAGQAPVDGYEVPARMAEALHLRNPACVFPWSPNLSRRKDRDHNEPYLPPGKGGPPGQTRLDNLACLSRLPHRLKTHGRWRLRQVAPGVYEWTSPHGYLYRVDHRGTRPLGKPGCVRADLS